MVTRVELDLLVVRPGAPPARGHHHVLDGAGEWASAVRAGPGSQVMRCRSRRAPGGQGDSSAPVYAASSDRIAGRSAKRTTRSGDDGGSTRALNGTPATTAIAHSVSTLGLPVPASSCDSVDFAIPARRASSAEEIPRRSRSRRMAAAIVASGGSGVRFIVLLVRLDEHRRCCSLYRACVRYSERPAGTSAMRSPSRWPSPSSGGVLRRARAGRRAVPGHDDGDVAAGVRGRRPAPRHRGARRRRRHVGRRRRGAGAQPAAPAVRPGAGPPPGWGLGAAARGPRRHRRVGGVRAGPHRRPRAGVACVPDPRRCEVPVLAARHRGRSRARRERAGPGRVRPGRGLPRRDAGDARPDAAPGRRPPGRCRRGSGLAGLRTVPAGGAARAGRPARRHPPPDGRRSSRDRRRPARPRRRDLPHAAAAARPARPGRPVTAHRPPRRAGRGRAARRTGTWFEGAGFAGWARPAGVAVAAGALLLRMPFVLVVVLAAATTAGLRLAGIG